jgi:hypothetical protein
MKELSLLINCKNTLLTNFDLFLFGSLCACLVVGFVRASGLGESQAFASLPMWFAATDCWYSSWLNAKASKQRSLFTINARNTQS